MSNRFITDGAGQEILGNLDAIQKTLAGKSASAASPSDFTGKQFLTEETGRDIASKLASIMESLASYVAPSAKKVQNKLSISVNGELTEYDGSAEETVDLEDGLEGLGIFRSTTSTSTGTTSISISTITVPEGRSLKVGDLIISNSTSSYLYRVTAVNASTVTVTYLQSLRGATGSRGATGTTPNISVSASVSNTTGTPSVTVTEGGTTAAPSFAFAFSGLKGDAPDLYRHTYIFTGFYSLDRIIYTDVFPQSTAFSTMGEIMDAAGYTEVEDMFPLGGYTRDGSSSDSGYKPILCGEIMQSSNGLAYAAVYLQPSGSRNAYNFSRSSVPYKSKVVKI